MKNNSIYIKKNSLSKLVIPVCIFFIIIIPLLLIWQGLDFTDIGYSLTCYQQIFNDPACIAYCLPNWMQYVIGGLWMKVFNNLGLMGINLGGVFITWITVFFTYKILNKYINKTILIFGLTITTIHSLDYINMIHYDNLSALFFIITIFLIMKYIYTNKTLYLFSAGIIECINTLVRLPNILGFIFILSVIIYNFKESKKIKKQIVDISIFLSGFIITLILSLLIMKQMNYLNIFVDGICGLFNVFSVQGNVHSSNSLLSAFFKNNAYAIGYSSLVIVSTIILSILVCKIKNRKLFIISSVAILLVILHFYSLYIITFIVGISYFVCALYILNIIKSSNNFRIINFLGLLLILISPVGTTIGQTVTIYTSWICLPIVISFLCNLYASDHILDIKIYNSIKQITFSIKAKSLKLISILLITFMSFYTLKNTYQFTYRDSSDRLSMKYTINNKYLKYTYTTKSRSEAVSELLSALKKYVHKNDYLWAEGSMSTVYYATETKPYVFNPWDSSLELPLEDALKKAREENFSLPVIIKQNVLTGDQNWPQEYCKWTDHYGIGEKHNNTVNDFIKKYNYKLVWSSIYFKIYTTNEKKYK